MINPEKPDRGRVIEVHKRKFPLLVFPTILALARQSRGSSKSQEGPYIERSILRQALHLSDPLDIRFVLSHPDLFTLTPMTRNDLAMLTAAKETLLHESGPEEGGNLITTPEGDMWGKMRAHARTVLSWERVREAGPTMATIVDDVIETWKNGQTIDVSHAIATITAKTIASLTLGSATAISDEEYDSILETVQSSIKYIGLRLLLGSETPAESQPLLHLSGQYKQFLENAKDIATTIHGILEKPANANSSFVREGQVLGLTDAQIESQLSAMIQAGFETTQSAIRWVLLHLSENRPWYDKVRSEALSAFPDGQIDPSELDKLPLLTACIQEALRMDPPVQTVFRYTTKPVTIAGHHLPAHFLVALDLATMHKSISHWENPDTFDPERWIDMSREDRKAFAPFADTAGSRKACVGMKLALLEAKMVIARMMIRGVRLTPTEGVGLQAKSMSATHKPVSTMAQVTFA